MTSVTLGPVVKLRLAAALLISDPGGRRDQRAAPGVQRRVARRVDPHITLVEPINVREDDLDEVHRILRDAAGRVRPRSRSRSVRRRRLRPTRRCSTCGRR